MIILGWDTGQGQVRDLMKRFAELPRHIAKKHLIAAIRRLMKDGIPLLKSITPKGGTRNKRNKLMRGAGGRFVTGSGKKLRVRGGALRRSVATKAKYIGRNKDGKVYGCIGYKAGFESRKAIWLEFGTRRGINPQRVMEKFRRQYGRPAASKLAKEMRSALAKAVAELKAGKNPTRIYEKGGSWRSG